MIGLAPRPLNRNAAIVMIGIAAVLMQCGFCSDAARRVAVSKYRVAIKKTALRIALRIEPLRIRVI